MRLIHSRGYQHTSMEAIAKEVGMQKVSLYYYFSSEEQILIGFLEEMRDCVAGSMSFSPAGCKRQYERQSC